MHALAVLTLIDIRCIDEYISSEAASHQDFASPPGGYAKRLCEGMWVHAITRNAFRELRSAVLRHNATRVLRLC